MSETKPLPTIARLDAAIRRAIGERVYDAMTAVSSSNNRPSMHADAIVQAFMRRLDDEDAEVLRTMYAVLRTQGFYPPESFRSEVSADATPPTTPPIGGRETEGVS